MGSILILRLLISPSREEAFFGVTPAPQADSAGIALKVAPGLVAQAWPGHESHMGHAHSVFASNSTG